LILFCDSSALVKLYVQEEGSDRMRLAAKRVKMVAAARIAYAEAMAALSRRGREAPVDGPSIGLAKQSLIADWDKYVLVEITQDLMGLAADLAETFALRGYDSVQLAAARMLQQSVGQAFQFASFDQRLSKAAGVLGMETL
jgi:predicted nucleic acid-binding protein